MKRYGHGCETEDVSCVILRFVTVPRLCMFAIIGTFWVVHSVCGGCTCSCLVARRLCFSSQPSFTRVDESGNAEANGGKGSKTLVPTYSYNRLHVHSILPHEQVRSAHVCSRFQPCLFRPPAPLAPRFLRVLRSHIANAVLRAGVACSGCHGGLGDGPATPHLGVRAANGTRLRPPRRHPAPPGIA